jgi:hypothetical protein
LVRADVDILRWLPPGDVTTFYADVKTLRRSGYLKLLAGNSDSDPDYRRFVQESNFDYWRDLDAIAGQAAPDALRLAIKGRLDWSRLRAYARQHDGSCRGESCTLPSSRPGRWLSFTELQPDVMLAAVAANPGASASLVNTPTRLVDPRPDDAVWLRPATPLLQKPNDLPFALRVFAIALQSAKNVTLSLAPAPDAAFNLKLTAHFGAPASAESARSQLDLDTRLLTAELGREHATANPADLTGLLTAGRFWRQDDVLYGTWPIRKELLNSLR